MRRLHLIVVAGLFAAGGCATGDSGSVEAAKTFEEKAKTISAQSGTALGQTYSGEYVFEIGDMIKSDCRQAIRLVPAKLKCVQANGTFGCTSKDVSLKGNIDKDGTFSLGMTAQAVVQQRKLVQAVTLSGKFENEDEAKGEVSSSLRAEERGTGFCVTTQEFRLLRNFPDDEEESKNGGEKTASLTMTFSSAAGQGYRAFRGDHLEVDQTSNVIAVQAGDEREATRILIDSDLIQLETSGMAGGETIVTDCVRTSESEADEVIQFACSDGDTAIQVSLVLP